MKEAYTIADIEFLIATQHKDSLDFIKPIFHSLDVSKINILIVNQTNESKLLVSPYPNIRVLNSFETGLSNSRNLALANALGKIIVVADDDVSYLENTLKTIVEAHNLYQEAVVIQFQSQKNSKQLLKKYTKNTQNPASLLTILNCSSIEMTIKNIDFASQNIKFDENFGINATFGLGEEALFLKKIKDFGKRIVFVSQTIVQHESETTSVKNSLQKNYYGFGAFYKQLFPKHHYLWLFLKMFFDLKQKKIKFKELPKAWKFAREGRNKLETLTQKGNT